MSRLFSHPSVYEYARVWGWVMVRGLAAVVFGVLAFVSPQSTLALLTLFWGAWVLTDGVMALMAAWRMRSGNRPLWPLVLVGLIGIVAGVVTFLWPGLTALSLLMLIAAWSILMGVLQIAAAVRLRQVIAHEWWLGLSGLISVLFGAFMMIDPSAGAVAVAWMIGAYAIVFGLMLLLLSLRLRRIAR
jgi:uncharacterized membrane protein HdeD (DUF308 family)